MFLFNPSKGFQEIAASMWWNNIKRHYQHFNIIRIIMPRTFRNYVPWYLWFHFVLPSHILLGLMKQHMAGMKHSGAKKSPVLTGDWWSNSLSRYAGFRAKAEWGEVGKNTKEMSFLWSGMHQFCLVAESCSELLLGILWFHLWLLVEVWYTLLMSWKEGRKFSVWGVVITDVAITDVAIRWDFSSESLIERSALE